VAAASSLTVVNLLARPTFRGSAAVGLRAVAANRADGIPKPIWAALGIVAGVGVIGLCGYWAWKQRRRQ
jgi:hypothetical protein